MDSIAFKVVDVTKAVDVIPDPQGRMDARRIAIQQVGIKGLAHPVQVISRSGEVQHTVARCNLYVNLPAHVKGTHMSRLVALLNGHAHEITLESFQALLVAMTTRLSATAGYLEMTFPYFVSKAAPVSGLKSLLEYEVSLRGELEDGAARLWIKVVVPVTSLCPCSKDIASYGAHNQRAHVTLTVRTEYCLSLEELIELVEAQASCELYGLLKRADEKYVTERAYENPKFVEDVVRDLAVALNADARILAYTVEAENFESIHNHSAYAKVERSEPDKENDT
jgi:GTP cyclohydrolase I